MSMEINDVGFSGKLRPDGARIGVIALATDLTIEADMPRMLPPQVSMYTNRVLNANPLTIDNLRAMRGDIARAAEGLLPGRGITAAVYACTSGSAAIGHARIAESIRTSHPQAEITTPLVALDAARQHLGVRRLSILTPYIGELNRAVAEHIASNGVDIININGLGFTDDTEVADIEPADIIRYAEEACDSQAEALFIACTAFRASFIIDELERRIKRPVLTSNQVLAWHAAKIAGYAAPIKGFGALLQEA